MALGYLISPVIQIENEDGKPLVGGHVAVYRHGTTVPYITYKDFNGDLNPASVPLNAIGSCILIADDATAYDIYVTNRFGGEVLSRLGVTVNGGVGGTGVVTLTSSDGSIVITNDGGAYDITMANDKPTVWVSSTDTASLTQDGTFSLVEGSKEGTGLELVSNVLTVKEAGWYHVSVNWHASKTSSLVNEYRAVSLLVNGASVGESLDMSKTADVQYGAWNGDLELDVDDTIVFTTSGLASDQKTSATLDKVSVHKLASVIGGGGSGGGVPDIHLGDDKKILQANYSGGAGSATWEDPAKVIASVLGYSYYGDSPADNVIRVHTSGLPDWGGGHGIGASCKQVLGAPDINYYDIAPYSSRFLLPQNTVEVVAAGVIDAQYTQQMFADCHTLENICDLIIDGNPQSFRSMFSNCWALKAMPSITTGYSALTDVSSMFINCWSMTESCLPLYQQFSANPDITSHGYCFYQYGKNTPAIAGDLDLIPQSWGGNAEG